MMWCLGKAYVVVAGDHLSVADIVADTVSFLVGINVIHVSCWIVGLLFLAVLTALRSLDIGDCLLTVLGRADLALWWRLLAQAHASRDGRGEG